MRSLVNTGDDEVRGVLCRYGSALDLHGSCRGEVKPTYLVNVGKAVYELRQQAILCEIPYALGVD